MRLRRPDRSNQTVRLKVIALAGLLVDATKYTNHHDARVVISLSRKNKEFQCISSASNPLTLAHSEKKRSRSRRRSSQRHVAVWPDVHVNMFVLENVVPDQLFQLDVFLNNNLSEPPRRIGSCQWSLSSKGTMNLTVTPVKASRQSSSAYIDQSGDAMLRIEVAIDDTRFHSPAAAPWSRSPPVNPCTEPQSHSLSPVQEEWVQAHSYFTDLRAKRNPNEFLQHNSIRLSKVRRFTFQRLWRRERKGRSWLQKLSTRLQRKTSVKYHRCADEPRTKSKEKKPTHMSADRFPSFVMDQTKSRNEIKRNETKIGSLSLIGRPESPCDPFGTSPNRSLDTTTTVESASGHESPGSSQILATPPLISNGGVDKDTLGVSFHNMTQHIDRPGKQLSENNDASDEEVEIVFEHDPGLVSDEQHDDGVEFTPADESDNQIELTFETDSSSILLVSDIREVDTPSGLASIFGCWESSSDHQFLQGGATVVSDSSSLEAILVRNPKQPESAHDESALPVKHPRKEASSMKSPSSAAAPWNKTKRPRKNWAWMESMIQVSEGFTDWSRCGPSRDNTTTKRRKKAREDTLLGTFVKRDHSENDTFYYLPPHRSPSSITMSDTVQW